MDDGSWFRKAIISSAVVLVAAMLVPAEAGAITIDHRMAGTRQVIDAGTQTGQRAEEPSEPNPTDDGSVIIECVFFANTLQSTTGFAALPQVPLGPSRCWSTERERTAELVTARMRR